MQDQAMILEEAMTFYAKWVEIIRSVFSMEKACYRTVSLRLGRTEDCCKRMLQFDTATEKLYVNKKIEEENLLISELHECVCEIIQSMAYRTDKWTQKSGYIFTHGMRRLVQTNEGFHWQNQRLHDIYCEYLAYKVIEKSGAHDWLSMNCYMATIEPEITLGRLLDCFVGTMSLSEMYFRGNVEWFKSKFHNLGVDVDRFLGSAEDPEVPTYQLSEQLIQDIGSTHDCCRFLRSTKMELCYA